MSKGYVYFVEAPGRIKIGFTTKPEARLVQLQTQDMERLSMIAIIDGSRKLERRLHQMAADYNFRREWFTDCPEVRAIIDRAVAGEIEIDEAPVVSMSDLPIGEGYFEMKRLPLLEARATATRLYREYLEEILTLIKQRKESGEPYARLVELVRMVDPDVIAAKHARLSSEPVQASDPRFAAAYS